MYIPKPFYPVEVEQEELNFRVRVVDREIVFGPNGMPISIQSQGVELLSEPVRLCGMEDGEPIVWDTNYPDNESEAFIHSRSDEKVVLCGAMASPRFIIDSCITTEYDGNMAFDIKVMPMGKTVAQEFGLAKIKPFRYQLDKLYFEIPLRKEAMPLFNFFPNSDYLLEDGTVIPAAPTTNAGRVAEQKMFFPFKAFLWLGDEERGLGFFAENWKNWQPEDQNKVIEIIPKDDQLLVRVHLLDRHPHQWDTDPAQGSYVFTPISFRFGLQATPVKPFPKTPYIHNGLHLDCFIKIKKM